MITPGLLDLEFPIFTGAQSAPEPPTLTVEEWADWLEEARALQSPEAFEEWLHDPASLPRGERFEL